MDTLAAMYPDAHCELRFRNPFELLIATILSAQSTDRQVNKVTERLFAKYPTPQDFLSLSEEELAEEIRGLGLYRNKSKNILQTCRILVEQYGGEVPAEREALEKLPGVGKDGQCGVKQCLRDSCAGGGYPCAPGFQPARS